MFLDLERLTLALHDSPIGHTIAYHRRIASTMPVAQQLGREPGTRSGTLVIAEEQTSGRGRFQRRWEAPSGQALLVSVILKPPFESEPSQLSMAVGVAVVQALEEFVPELAGRVGLKWPNDVLLATASSGQERDAGKVAGILVETAYQGTDLVYAIAGIGINVNQTAARLPPRQPGAPAPASLRVSLGHERQQELDRTALLIILCRALARFFGPVANRPDIYAEWRSLLWTLGQQVDMLENGIVIYQGKAIDVARDGTLLVADNQGGQRNFAAGDASLRSL